jgi:hypothetical protein
MDEARVPDCLTKFPVLEVLRTIGTLGYATHDPSDGSADPFAHRDVAIWSDARVGDRTDSPIGRGPAADGNPALIAMWRHCCFDS